MNRDLIARSESVPHRIQRVCAASLLLLAQLLIRAYRLTVSPWIGPSCRFAPSCSVYASEALRRYGLVRGGWAALRRLLRCHPFHPGGWDPVR